MGAGINLFVHNHIFYAQWIIKGPKCGTVFRRYSFKILNELLSQQSTFKELFTRQFNIFEHSIHHSQFEEISFQC